MNKPNYDITEYEFPPKNLYLTSNSFTYNDIDYLIFDSGSNNNLYKIFNQYGDELSLNDPFRKRSIYLCMSKQKISQKVSIKLSNPIDPNLNILKISIYGSNDNPKTKSDIDWVLLNNPNIITPITDYAEYYTNNINMQFKSFKLDFELLYPSVYLSIRNIQILFAHPLISIGSGENIIYCDSRSDSSLHFGTDKKYSVINEFKKNTNDLVFCASDQTNLTNLTNPTNSAEIIRLLNSKNKSSVAIGTSQSENNKLKVNGGISLDYINKSEKNKKTYIGLTNKSDGENLGSDFNGIIFNDTPLTNYISFGLTNKSIGDNLPVPTKELFKINDKGYVGIGNNTNMRYPLDVKYDYFTNDNSKYFVESDTFAYNNFKASKEKNLDKTPVSINTNGAILSEYGFISKADKRTIQNYKYIPSTESLYKITKLKLSSYNYIADRDISTSNETGFLIDDIETNISDAVTNISEYVPIPYKMYKIDPNEINPNITINANTNMIFLQYEMFTNIDNNFISILKQKNELRLKMYLKYYSNSNTDSTCDEVFGIAKYSENYPYVIISISLIEYVLINTPLNIFIWGYLTDDFKTIEKDYIYNTGIASINHLTKINYYFHELTDDIEKRKWTDDSIGSIVYLTTSLTENVKNASIKININDNNFVYTLKDNCTDKIKSDYSNNNFNLIITFNGVISIKFNNNIDILSSIYCSTNNSTNNSNNEFQGVKQANISNFHLNSFITIDGKITSVNTDDISNSLKSITDKNNKIDLLNTTTNTNINNYSINCSFDGEINNDSTHRFITNIIKTLKFKIKKNLTESYISYDFNQTSFNADIILNQLFVPITNNLSTDSTNTSNLSNLPNLPNQANLPSTPNLPLNNITNTITKISNPNPDPTVLYTTNLNINIPTQSTQSNLSNLSTQSDIQDLKNTIKTIKTIDLAYDNYYFGSVYDVIEIPNSLQTSNKIIVIANKGIVKLMYLIKNANSTKLKYGNLLCTSTNSDAGFVILQEGTTITSNTIAKCLIDITFDMSCIGSFVKIECLLI